MKDKTLYTLSLGGTDVTLKFKIGALRSLKALLSGEDPWVAVQKKMTETEAIDFAEKIIIAGMTNQDPKADVSNITELVNDLMPADAGNVIAAFLKAYTPDPDPAMEGKQDTQGEVA